MAMKQAFSQFYGSKDHESMVRVRNRRHKKALRWIEKRMPLEWIDQPPSTKEELLDEVIKTGHNPDYVISYVRHEYTNYDQICDNFYGINHVSYDSGYRVKVHLKFRYELVKPYLESIGWDFS